MTTQEQREAAYNAGYQAGMTAYQEAAKLDVPRPATPARNPYHALYQSREYRLYAEGVYSGIMDAALADLKAQEEAPTEEPTEVTLEIQDGILGHAGGL